MARPRGTTAPSASDSGDRCADLQRSAKALECGGTLKERRNGPSVTVKSPGRAYRLDCDEGRAWLDLSQGQRCADGAIWLPGREPPTLLFVELKSGSIHEAVAQLQQVVCSWRARANALDCHVRLEAAVVMSGSAPTDQKRLKHRFRKATGLVLRLRSGRRNASIPAEKLLR